MKKSVLLSILLVCSGFLYGQINDVSGFLEKKVEYYNSESVAKEISVIDSELKLVQDNKSKYSEELFLTLENNFIVLKTDLMPKEGANRKKIFMLLNNQNNKNKEYMDGKNLKKLSSDYLVSVADLKCRIINYLAKQENYEESMFAEELYKAAIKNDKNNAMAYVGYGTWLFFAPPIVGGGIEAAEKMFAQGVKKAKTDAELYFALIYESQALYLLGEDDNYNKNVEKAEKLAGTDIFVKVIKEINEKDSVFFE